MTMLLIRLVIIIVYFSIFLCLVYSDPFLMEVENLDYLKSCIGVIQRNYFDPNDFIIYLSLSKNSREFLINSDPIIIQTDYLKQLISFRLTKSSGYIITGTNEQEIIDAFKCLVRSLQWNPRARFMIILEEETNLKKMFRMLKHYYVYNVIVMFRNSFNSKYTMFTYFPYNYLVPEDDRSKAVVINSCVQGKLKKNITLFPNKLPKSWINTTVRLVLFKYPPYVIQNDTKNCGNLARCGIEINALTLMQQIMGFKIKILNESVSKWGHKLLNDSYNGATNIIYNYEADIGIGAFYLNFTEIWDLDSSYPYIDDSMTWIVPAAKFLARWKSLLLFFSTTVWLTSILCFLIVSSTLYLIAKYLVYKASSYQDVFYDFLVTFQLLIGQVATSLPGRLAFRMIIGSWLMFSFVMRSSFQGNTTLGLNLDAHEKQISTAEEIIASGLKFGFHDENRYLFSNPDNPDIYLYKNYIPCSRGSECTNRTAFKGDFATLKTRRFLQYMTSRYYISPKGHPLVYIFNDQVRALYISMVFVKGFPLMEDFNKLLIQMQCHGFIEHYYEVMQQLKKRILYRRLDLRTGLPDQLQLTAFEGAFRLLIYGHIVGLVVFLAEYFTRFDYTKIIKNKPASNKAEVRRNQMTDVHFKVLCRPPVRKY